MALALGIASLLAQLAAFAGIGYLIGDLVSLPRVFFPDGGWTVAQLLPHVFETAASYWAAFVLGAVSAAAAALIMIRGRLRARWFLSVCRALGWLWIPLLPIGTVLGILLLYARRRALGGVDS